MGFGGRIAFPQSANEDKMTFKNDTKSGDLLASEMETILASDEYKEMFKKEAQWVDPNTGMQPGAQRTDSGMTNISDPGNAGTGAMQSQVDPAKTPTGPMLSGDVKSQLSQIKANPALAGINGDAVAELAGKICLYRDGWL